ncbi:hypothetical protein [Rhodovulum sp. P5]|uniref:hypothetical protein n=1 Tax=Rhodovulum sp. P5 TaxID=1564506 RepID=UPI0009DACF61|nr:hypothetical protein [Rhodovulum sp. P5]
MIADPNNCCEIRNDPLIVCGEKKREFCVKNPGKLDVQVCRVDGCILTGDEKKCDISLCVAGGFFALVEFKGTDVVYALEQLIVTAEQLSKFDLPLERRTYIVGAPAPKANTRYQKKLKALRSRYAAVGFALPKKANNRMEIVV